MNRRRDLAIGCILLSLAVAAAGKRPGAEPEPPGPAAATAEQMATYSWLRRNVFSMCMYCHVAVPGVSFANYQETIKHVVPGQPERSILYLMVLARRMPKGRGGLPEEQLRALHDWIGNGARND